jgi:hypothetical protein
MTCQLLGHIAWSLAVNGETSIPVMVIEEPAEALLAHFKAQVIASGYSGRLGKAFDDCDNARPPLCSDLRRDFDWRLINRPVHFHSHPSQLLR